MPTNLLTFRVIPQSTSIPSDARFQGFLNQDRWDDWGKYCTQFYLTIVDSDGISHQIGNVKIGQIGLKPHGSGPIPAGHRKPALDAEFESLGDRFFSLGQEEDYYERLAGLGDSLREQVLTSLRDVAFNAELWSKVKTEDVMGESLLRSVTATTVEGQFRRMARGGARLTRYSFSFAPPKRLSDGNPPFKLDFYVDPRMNPPTNVHVLIGRNGVGKTRMLALMTKALVAAGPAARQSGSFVWERVGETHFANLVTVSFSAFDDTELPPETAATEGQLKYSYVGLRRNTEADSGFGKPKTPQMLATEFVKSLAKCQAEPQKRRWLAALAILESDPVFKSAGLNELISQDLKDEEQRTAVTKTFSLLSSGHKIVLLTLTRLVETVEEKTLVLIDEPEAHLHPPLLAGFVRALSNLLVDRNGVTIIATHSPVVLQEVPKTCVWILSRSLRESKAERPSVETFGENVGILSREVFQLELSQSGFHKLLEKVARDNPDYNAALFAFEGQLGAEAKAVLRAMLLEKDAQNPEE